jgi:hypothetical protein
MKRLLFILLIPITACAPWTRVSGPLEGPAHHYSVDIPSGWMKFDSDQYLLLSRDGPFLQYILVESRDLGAPFTHTMRRMNRDMLPQEAAEVILDDLSLDQAVRNLHVLENAPARIARQDGFKILFTYQNGDGLTLKTLYYGFITGRMYYSIRYTAAERYYFGKDMETFRKVLAGFRLLDQKRIVTTDSVLKAKSLQG